MSTTFDPYHVWLGIPPAEQPPSHYRLLALAPFEDAPEVIENAADRQMTHVRRAASGKHADKSQQILNEISAARRCLLQAEMKSGYDAQLRAKEKPLAKAEPIPAIAATMEWTPPPKPPKPKAKPPAPPKKKPVVADDGQRWKGAPPEHADGVGVVATSNVLQRARSKQSNTWIVMAVIGLLATLPIIALLIALAMMDQETTVAQDDAPTTATNVSSPAIDEGIGSSGLPLPGAGSDSTGDEEDIGSSGLPLPGAGSDSTGDEEDIGFRSRRPWRDRPRNDRPGRRDDRDPLDDTPSFGEVELDSGNPASGNVVIEETITLSAKTTMIPLALLRLPTATATGIQLKAGQTVKLNIDGQIRIGGQAHDLRGPEGVLIAVGQREQIATQHFKGAPEVEFTVEKPGELFLAVEDLLNFDNQGDLTVEVVVED